MENNNPLNIEEKVMNKITTGKVRLRSKYVFLAEKLGIGSAFILSVFLSGLFLSLALFYLKTTGNLWFLSLGSRGLYAFFESFPYLPVIIFILIIFLSGFILKKTGVLYNRPFGHMALALLGTVVILGFLFSISNIAENFDKKVFRRPPPYYNDFRPMFNPALKENRHGVIGRIMQKSESSLTVQTPFGLKTVELSNSQNYEFKEGDFVIITGENSKENFEAETVVPLNRKQAPIINEVIEERFGNFDPDNIKFPIDSEKRHCFNECFKKHEIPEICRDLCLREQK